MGVTVFGMIQGIHEMGCMKKMKEEVENHSNRYQFKVGFIVMIVEYKDGRERTWATTMGYYLGTRRGGLHGVDNIIFKTNKRSGTFR